MKFINVPESQSLTSKSKFVYSEDDEHLKYINIKNLKKNIPKCVKNSYGIDIPNDDSNIPGITYDKLNYSYTNDIFNTYLDFKDNWSSYTWKTDIEYYLPNGQYPRYDQLYQLENNKLNFKLFWSGWSIADGWHQVTYDDINHVGWTSETHESYIDSSSGRYTPYTYTRVANTSDIMSIVRSFQLFEGSYQHMFFPIDGNTYELSFKVRLHNLVNESTLDYYIPSEYFINLNNHGKTEPVPEQHQATFVNGIGVHFNDRSMGVNTAVSSFRERSGIPVRYPYFYKYDGLMEYYDHPAPNVSVRNDRHMVAGPDTPRPATVVGSHPIGEYASHDTKVLKQWSLAWKELPAWEQVRIRNALSMELEDVELMDEYGLYEGYFVRFGSDDGWHEYTFTFNPDDYVDDIDHLKPTISFLLSGLHPASAGDAYIEIKDFEIKSRPYTISTFYYKNIDKLYLKKDGIWLPDTFTKESEQTNVTPIKQQGTKIAEASVGTIDYDILAPALVTNASVTPNYNDGFLIGDLSINGTVNHIYSPYKVVTDVKVLTKLTPQSSSYNEYSIVNNQVATLSSIGRRSGIKVNSDGELYAGFDTMDGSYSFGLVDLNGTYSYRFLDSDARNGYWICNIEFDVSTSTPYIPDSVSEYFKVRLSGGTGAFYYLSSFDLEKRIPAFLFQDTALNHYKISIPFIYYASNNYFSILSEFKGSLKSGVSLMSSANLVTRLTARRIVDY